MAAALELAGGLPDTATRPCLSPLDPDRHALLCSDSTECGIRMYLGGSRSCFSPSPSHITVLLQTAMPHLPHLSMISPAVVRHTN
jgi:hypothetical protein